MALFCILKHDREGENPASKAERVETGEAETIRSKANKIKKKMGVLRERKRVEGVGFCWV